MVLAGFTEALALHRRGRVAEAAERYRLLLQTAPEDAEILRCLGLALLQSGDLAGSELHLTHALRMRPGSPNTLSDLAALRLLQKRYPEAIAAFTKALRSDPKHVDALHNLAVALCDLDRPLEALPLLERLVQVAPSSATALRRLGETLSKVGRLDDSVKALRQALSIEPGSIAARISLADAFESAGRFKQATMQYAAVLQGDPQHVLALARALQIQEGAVDPAWLETAERLVSEGEKLGRPRVQLAIALAHYYDRQGAYARAFDRLHSANQALSAKTPHEGRHFTTAIDRLIAVFTKQLLASGSDRAGSQSDRPIFIVGMPRSGTTLTEQILASHSQVVAGGELAGILDAGRQVDRWSPNTRKYPEAVADLTADQLTQLSTQYLDALKVVSQSGRHVTDKLPFNFMHLGLIALAFPRAHIIHCVRHPLDTCLSCYFTSFADQIRFANDLDTLANYYLNYRRLMAHWQEVLPMPLLNLSYESLVLDTRSNVQRLLEFCGLEWEDACLAFHRTEGERTDT